MGKRLNVVLLSVWAALCGCWSPRLLEHGHRPSVLPAPKHANVADATVALPAPVMIGLSPQAGETERYAAEMLQEDVKTCFGIDASITDGEDRGKATVVIGTATPAGPAGTVPDAIKGKREAYVIRLVGERGRPQAVITGSDPAGAMYGVFTLSQLFTKRDGALRLPLGLEIEDWPSMETRGVADSPGDVSPASLEQLDFLARCRVNALCYQHFDPFMQEADENGELRPVEWTQQCRPALGELVKEAHKRGMLLYGGLSTRWSNNDWYFGGPATYENPEQRHAILALFEQMAGFGVDGLMFLLDDNGGAVPAHELGREHVAWARSIKETAARHGIRRVAIGFPDYRTGWKAEYYEPFKQAEDLADVAMLFGSCAPAEVAAAKKAGLRNYEWRLDDVRGPADLRSGFASVDAGYRGRTGAGCPPEFRALAGSTKRAWLRAGDDGELPVWGAYLWHPEGYSSEAVRCAAANVLLGRGASGPCEILAEHLQTWAANIENQEGSAGDMLRSEQQARNALAQLVLITRQEERPGLLPKAGQRRFMDLYESDLSAVWRAADRVSIMSDRELFMGTIVVPLKTPLAGTDIRYTLDGSEPTADLPSYSEPIVLTSSAIVKARAFRAGRPVDETVSRAFTKVPMLWDHIDTVEIKAERDHFIDAIAVVFDAPPDKCDVRYTLDGSEPTANSPLYNGPITLPDTATVKARVFRDGRAVGKGPASRSFTKLKLRRDVQPRGLAPGLRFEYYEGDWSKIPDFESLRPAAEGVAEKIDLSPRKRNDFFALRFSGYIRVPRDGVYKFVIGSDDGSRISVGDELLAERDGLHWTSTAGGVIALAAGYHPVTVDYFDREGGEELYVLYDGPDIRRQPIPETALFHKTVDADSTTRAPR